MRKGIFFLAGLLCILLFSTSAFAVGTGGTTNKAPAATLIVPFFEVGIDETEDPLDTLLVVTNTGGNATTFHYHVWDIDGNATTLNGNIDLANLQTWSGSMRALISGAASSVKDALTQGDFYQGFVTIDVVSAATTLNPLDAAYPFDDDNDLEGFIYYVRLEQGSSNGIDMIPIEYVGSSVDAYLSNFYQNSDGREEIDGRARECLERLSNEQECDGSIINNSEMAINSRVFLAPSYNAESRIIVFTWFPGEVGGPSIYCATHSCATSYAYWRMNESGIPVQTTTTTLDHVVNVIDVSGTANGWVQIGNITNVCQIFAFSFNSANSGDASKNWDAIFESYLYHYN